MARITGARSSGFTLVELIIVMIVIAIMTATVALRLSAATEHAATTNADQLRRNLSHVQALALGSGVRLRVAVAADGSSYTVRCQTALGRAPCTVMDEVVIDPATGQSFIVPLASGVVLQPFGDTLDIDSLGRPVLGGSLIATNPARTYSLISSRSPVKVTVLPITGFASTIY